MSSYYQVQEETRYPTVLVLGNSHKEYVIQAAKFSARLQKAHSENEAYFYSAARPLSEEVRLVFLWNEIEETAH
jgi:prolyl oligopeptidase PreP (S9A serine peptidase family)